ncbi:MAG: HutP family protein [Synergistaceae bacterium]|jgi:hut operon positive regulator|nr:HutP family protein [Synergistaceae bacterium]
MEEREKEKEQEKENDIAASRGRAEEEKTEEKKDRSPLDFDFDSDDVARAAVLVALTKNAEMEAVFKQHIERCGWHVVATEVGGLLNDLPTKLVRAIVGAALNAGVIEKSSREMHSLVHAAIEAGDSFIHRGILEISMGAKISIVRSEQWIAVAIFGDCAVHAAAHHDRCGLGMMHI